MVGVVGRGASEGVETGDGEGEGGRGSTVVVVVEGSLGAGGSDATT